MPKGVRPSQPASRVCASIGTAVAVNQVNCASKRLYLAFAWAYNDASDTHSERRCGQQLSALWSTASIASDVSSPGPQLLRRQCVHFCTSNASKPRELSSALWSPASDVSSPRVSGSARQYLYFCHSKASKQHRIAREVSLPRVSGSASILLRDSMSTRSCTRLPI